MLFKRIQYIIDMYYEGNLTAFARDIKIAQSTLQKNIAAKNEKNLAKHCIKILAAMPQIEGNWLLRGEGEAPVKHGTAQTPVCNKKKKRIGELLSVALDFYDITPEEVEKYAGINPQELDSVLSGLKKPDFEFLENMYSAFGINPAYLFHCDERAMREAKEPIDRAFQAVGKFSRYPVAYYQLEELFGASEEDAKEYADAYRKWKADLKTFARSNKPLDPTSIPESPDHPGRWIYDFAQQVTVNLAWLDNSSSPPYRFKTRTEIQRELDQSQNDTLRNRICELEKLLSDQIGDMKSLQEQLVIAQKEIILLQKQYLLASSDNPNLPFQTAELAPVTDVANGVREDGKN